MQEVEREILLSFWKAHILHHAEAGPIHGQWIAEELREHGYEISHGTLYPLLSRLTKRGWLACKTNGRHGPRARKDYRLTLKGKKVLALVREQIKELHHEVVEASQSHKK